jgi:hypothetical protein
VKVLILVMIFMFHNLPSFAQTAPPKNVSAFQPVVREKNVVREWAAPELEFIHFPNEALEPPSPNRWDLRSVGELREGTILTPETPDMPVAHMWTNLLSLQTPWWWQTVTLELEHTYPNETLEPPGPIDDLRRGELRGTMEVCKRPIWHFWLWRRCTIASVGIR